MSKAGLGGIFWDYDFKGVYSDLINTAAVSGLASVKNAVNDFTAIPSYRKLTEQLAAIGSDAKLLSTDLTAKADVSESDSVGLKLERLAILNKLAAETYESEYCTGRVVFTDDEIGLKLEFEKSVKFHIDEYVALRKLVQMSSEKFVLVILNDKAVGMADYDEDINDNDTVTFLGYKIWQLERSGQELHIFKDGEPISTQSLDEASFPFIEEIKKLTPGASKSKQDNFKKIFKYASEQKHGTMLVFTDDAEHEVARLAKRNRGVAISTVKCDIKTRDRILAVTAIDGCVFFDENGFCRGLGFILDGEAVIRGNPARGARYNSAKNYIALKRKESKNTGKNYVAVVISEDKRVEVFSSFSEDFEYVD